MRSKGEKRVSKRRISTLIVLVIFVFIILLVSVVVAALTSGFLINAGIFPPVTENRISSLLLFLSLISVFIGTVLALVGGDYFLRPLRQLTEATKEVASGNFDIQIDTTGTRELSHLASSFNEMAKELSGIETLRNDFVSNISHEFKTPVVSIRGFARRLKKNTLSEEQRDEYLDIIISETERLSKLSSNVLLLSKLESTEKVAEKNRFSLDEQIRKSILLLEPLLEKKHLNLDIDMKPVQITANEEMISHIWINILDNAIKFSPEGGTIKIAAYEDKNLAQVFISDEGPGMDDDMKRHIFDKFYQGDKSRVTEGNGLGLSLIKRILHLSNGKIAVESTLGRGTCFTISLPAEDGLY